MPIASASPLSFVGPKHTGERLSVFGSLAVLLPVFARICPSLYFSLLVMLFAFCFLWSSESFFRPSFLVFSTTDNTVFPGIRDFSSSSAIDPSYFFLYTIAPNRVCSRSTFFPTYFPSARSTLMFPLHIPLPNNIVSMSLPYLSLYIIEL